MLSPGGVVAAGEHLSAWRIDEIVDTGRYPLDDPEDRRWAEAVAGARAALGERGCAVLRGVVRPDRLAWLRAETAAVAPTAHHRRTTVNVYNTDPDPALPADHPARITFERRNAFVARDRIPAGDAVHRLYTSAPFQRLVAACFGLDAVHELADPFAGLTVNVLVPGADHPWHFDTNEMTVSLLTRAADAGGDFEYCPDLRGPDRENSAAVRAVLDGERTAVRRLGLHPGDLQLFRGRWSLHRVTPVRGSGPRLSAIFAYGDRPGIVGDATRTRQLFGRVAPAHLRATRWVPA